MYHSWESKSQNRSTGRSYSGSLVDINSFVFKAVSDSVLYIRAKMSCRNWSRDWVCSAAVSRVSLLEPITKHQYIDWSKCLGVLLCKHTPGLVLHVLSVWILSGFKTSSFHDYSGFESSDMKHFSYGSCSLLSTIIFCSQYIFDLNVRNLFLVFKCQHTRTRS